MNYHEFEINPIAIDCNSVNSQSIDHLEKRREKILLNHAIEKAIPVGIAVFNEVGKQVYVNPSFCNLTGFEASEMLEDFAPFKFCPATESERIRRAIQDGLNTDIANEKAEFVFCHKSGIQIPVKCLITTFKDENQEKFWMLNVIGIRKRDKAERVHQEFLEKLPLLIKNSNDIILLVNKNKEQYFISDVAERITGYTPDELKGPIGNVIHPDDLGFVMKSWEKSISEKSDTLRIQYRHIHKQKGYIWLEAVAQNYFDHPALHSVVVNVRDISENKEFELKLQESEKKFKEIINQINDGIVVYDENGKIVIWNQGAEKILGIKTSEAISNPINDIQNQLSAFLPYDSIQTESAPEVINIFRKPKTFNRITDHEIILQNPIQKKNIQSRIFPIKFDNTNLVCTVFRDTTEIKQYEQALLQLNADKDRFLYILAHDLRSPFNSILGFLDLLTANIHEYDIQKIEKQIGFITDSSERVFNLLEATLLWARAQSGKIPYQPRVLNLMAECIDVIENINPSAINKAINIHQLVDEKIRIYADPDMLKTVLRNLISNAIKFTNKGGSINVFAEEDDSGITVVVSDDGVGINPKKANKLFDMTQFYSTQGTAKEPGTGLGLLICKEFVEKHGGKIWAESIQGSGSDFKFSLPGQTPKTYSEEPNLQLIISQTE